MSELTNVPHRDIITMSSREIAELVEARHDSVKRTMERLQERGLIRFTPLVETSHEGAGARDVEVYRVGKRDSYIIVAQLSPEFTARLVDRWQQLEEQVVSRSLALPDFSSPAEAARAWAEQYEGREIALRKAAVLESHVTEMAPKAEALDRIASAEGSLCVTDAAKALQVQPKKLFGYLRQNGWCYRRLGCKHDLGYQDKVKAGLLEHKVSARSMPDGSEKISEQVRITAKGITKLAEIFQHPSFDI
jgi:phage antirepressor YoqD-like protein